MKRLGAWIDLDEGAELDDIDELPAETRHVQFQHGLTDDRFRHLGQLLAGRPEISLRAYRGPDIADLEFLRFFPGLRTFHVDAIWEGLASIDGLRHVATSLETLGIGRTKRPLSLAVLRDLRALRSVSIEGRHRDLTVIASLAGLEQLTLRSITLPDLGLLVGLGRLRSLDVKLGGTKDLALLAQLTRLEELELWHVNGLVDISPISDLLTLQTLFLQALPRIRALPDLSRLTELRTVTLHTMKGITDLAPLADAQGLAKLLLVAMPHLAPEALRPLVGHPKLRRGNWNIGSMRKTYQAHDVLPIEPEPFGYAEWRAGVPYRTILEAWMTAMRVGTREVDGRMVLNPDRAAKAAGESTTPPPRAD